MKREIGETAELQEATFDYPDLFASCPYSSRAHAGAWKRGASAALAGRPRKACPYNEWAVAIVGRGRHIPTGERGFARAWKKGWDVAQPLQQAPENSEKP